MEHPNSCEVTADSIEAATQKGMAQLGLDSPEDMVVEVLDENPPTVRVSRLAEALPSARPQRRTRSTRTRRTFRRPTPRPTVVIGDAAAPGVPAGVPASQLGLEPSRARPRQEYTPTEEDADAVEQCAVDLLEATGLEYEFELESGDYQRLFIELPKRAAGSLIGRRGATIDAIEYLLGRLASQKVGHLVPVQVDVNEYRARREEELRELAASAAQTVLESGRDYHVEPMHARERRVIHIEVKKIDGLETYTVGEGSQRHVIISRLDSEGDGET